MEQKEWDRLAEDYHEEVISHFYGDVENPLFDELKNVSLCLEDIRKIKYKNKFDVIISVNSIIMPSYNDIDKSFSNLKKALKKEGRILMILPSMESVIYNGSLIF